MHMVVEIEGREYPVLIERKKNKNTYLRVKENGVIFVTTNYFSKETQIEKLLKENKRALGRMISKVEKRKKRNEEFYYLGNPYDVIFVTGLQGVDVKENQIYVQDEKALNHWLKLRIKELFQKRYEIYYERFQKKIPRYPIRIRSMKTRWGVCNRKSKTITLNSRLIEYPIACLDYVIVHEISHLIYFDHSKNFWATVSKYYPDYKEARKILKD